MSMLSNVVALDAGGATLKASVVAPYSGAKASASGNGSAPFVLANHVATLASSSAAVLIGQELLDKEQQGAKLRYVRPVERGYCVNWNIETDIWTHLFSHKASHDDNAHSLTHRCIIALGIDPHEHTLVATAPLFAPSVLTDTMDQVVFEDFGFQAFARVRVAEMCVLSYAEQCRASRPTRATEPVTSAASPMKKRRRNAKATATTSALQPDASAVEALPFEASSCQLVVDAGFSFTHVVPIVDGRVVASGVKRINVGGKLLTNYLKEIVSYRQWNVMDDTRVMNALKEAQCYVARDFETEMRALYALPRRERTHWVLPDYVHSFTGHVRSPADGDSNQTTTTTRNDDDHQALELSTELIAVPEVLFHPSDIGLAQAGVAEAIVQAVAACPSELHASLYANILLVGGSTKFRNFHDRLAHELRSLIPIEYTLGIHAPTDPITAAWDGCARFAASAACADRVVTKQEYDEHGSNICLQRF